MKKLIKRILSIIGIFLTEDLRERIACTNDILIHNYINQNLLGDPKYSDPKKLNRYEYQVYSQNGEDGIIQEIFKRTGTANKFFAEFGVENGLECNSLHLLLQGWTGCWLDGVKKHIMAIEDKFALLINDKKLSVKQAFITAENIEELFGSLSVPKELDLLSIDIDGNDYWVWKAIKDYSPRVVVIEYNAIFRPPVEFIVRYEADKIYRVVTHFGASLKSLEILGASKGYKLVGCNFSGSNAFFVRQDLVKDKFLGPFTAENHYEPLRNFLVTKTGQKRDFGAFEDTSITN